MRDEEQFYTEQSLMDVLVDACQKADGRRRQGMRYKMILVVLVIVIGFLLGANSYRGVDDLFNGTPDDPNDYKEDIIELLGHYVDVEKHGFPKYYVISRVMKKAKPTVLVEAVAQFFYQLMPPPDNNGEKPHIAIDGKALKGAENKALTGKNIYLVNVIYAGFRLYLWQTRVGPKTMEAKTIEEEISDILFGNPAVVTFDALSTRKTILNQIVGWNSTAVMPVKSNNRKLEDFLINALINYTYEHPEYMDHEVTLPGGYSGNETPGIILENVRCKYFEEDNRKEEENPEEKPLSTLVLFDEQYDYLHAQIVINGAENLPNPAINTTDVIVPTDDVDREPEVKEETLSTDMEPIQKGPDTIVDDGANTLFPEPIEAGSGAHTQTEDGESSINEDPPEIIPGANSVPVVDHPTPVVFSSPVRGIGSVDNPDGIDWSRVRTSTPGLIKPELDLSNNKLAYVLVNGNWIVLARNKERFERREYTFLDDKQATEELKDDPVFAGWENVHQVLLVTRYRAKCERDNNTKEVYWNLTITRTPYIISDWMDKEKVIEIIQGHWDVEEFHAILDNQFDEDASTIRAGNAPENVSLLRKIAYNIAVIKQKMLEKFEGKPSTFIHIKRGFGRKGNIVENIRGILDIFTSRIRSPFH